MTSPVRTSIRRSVGEMGKLAGGRFAVVFDAAFGSRARGRCGILYYHRVCDPPRGLPAPTLNVSPATFRRQISGLLDRGFRFVTVGELLDAIDRQEPIAQGTVAVTFDDGFEGVWRYAWPVLRELGVRASLFVATGFLGSADPFPFDPWGRAHQREAPGAAWAPLTWQHCDEMVRSGEVEIGTHTHTHADFRGQPFEFADDLRTSVRAIRDRLEIETSLLSFPFGSARRGFVSPELIKAARDGGMRCGLTTTMDLVDPRSDPFRWGRFEAVGSDTAATLAAKLEGWYSWMESARAAFRSIS
jgi:peptidoglycan/xylan/chitin deacetylase (PgdA/CDA1 family)